MTLTEFLKRLLGHLAIAAVVWMLLVLFLEKLIPGFVASFFDVPFIGLVIICMLVVASMVHVSPTRLGKVTGIVILTLLLLVATAFVWAGISMYGWSGIVLLLCIGLSGGLTIYALAVDSDLTP